jgi:hypothetical protein
MGISKLLFLGRTAIPPCWFSDAHYPFLSDSRTTRIESARGRDAEPLSEAAIPEPFGGRMVDVRHPLIRGVVWDVGCEAIVSGADDERYALGHFVTHGGIQPVGLPPKFFCVFEKRSTAIVQRFIKPVLAVGHRVSFSACHRRPPLRAPAPGARKNQSTGTFGRCIIRLRML